MSKDIMTMRKYTARLNWPLDRKIRETQDRISQWFEAWGGNTSVSFSGGLDSTVLLDIVRSHPNTDIRKTPACFADTGAEYPEIRKFIKSFDGITWVRPQLKFKDVIKRYGYPVVSKRVSQYVKEVQRAKTSQVVRLRLTGWRKNGTHSALAKIPTKWHFLVGAPFQVSDKCCHCLKKCPMKAIVNPMVGVRATEAKNREKTYLLTGCNAFDINSPRSWPIAFWTDADIREYISTQKLQYCEIYDKGYKRTGCFPCCFGVHLEPWPNRFQLMQKTHPRLWNLCMDFYGIERVFEFMNEWLPKREQISYKWEDYVQSTGAKDKQLELF